MSGDRKAIVGIALGADGKTGSGEILLMAGKAAYVDPYDKSMAPAFVTVIKDGKAKRALGGGLVADGIILGRHVAATQTFQAPVIDGGSLNVGNDRFAVNSEGQVSISASSGDVGMKITNDNINIYDENGVLQVQFGLLTD